jgi:hypothetical protein
MIGFNSWQEQDFPLLILMQIDCGQHGLGLFHLVQTDLGMKLTTHHHLVPMLRMLEPIPQLHKPS